MYDQHVGEHCCECRQKDWLALRCKFCGEHFKPEQHACPKYSYEQEKKVYTPPPAEQKVNYLCVSCRAKLTPLNYAHCRDCNLYYCLEHRFHEDHRPPAPPPKESSYCSTM